MKEKEFDNKNTKYKKLKRGSRRRRRTETSKRTSTGQETESSLNIENEIKSELQKMSVNEFEEVFSSRKQGRGLDAAKLYFI